MMFKKVFNASLVFAALVSANVSAKEYTTLSVEEKRIPKAKQAMPKVTSAFDERVEGFAEQVKLARSYTTLTQLVIRHGDGLWRDAVLQFEQAGRSDDRALYWARLKMSKALKASKPFNELFPMQQEKLLWKLELLTRGKQDVKFNKKADKKILITGFDPFFLDRNIGQSNPSGVAALALDDLFITSDGRSAEIESLIIPVRFKDFDEGMIEELLTPYFKDVDMIATISMGRSDFDLERFPGLRRSAQAPDNLNVHTGASSKNPIIPMLRGERLDGPEFVKFSLPVDAMSTARGPYKINDNHKITTLEGDREPKSLSELQGQISVQGAGGGYLSNEISYRSILLRDALNPSLPVGHIHTPRINGYEPGKSKAIVEQIKQMLTKSIGSI